MDNKYFIEALSSMVNNAAYGDAIKHMHDSGLSKEEIYEKLEYPVSIEKIEAYISDYEKKKASEDSCYEYIERYDNYGKKSYIRVKKV